MNQLDNQRFQTLRENNSLLSETLREAIEVLEFRLEMEQEEVEEFLERASLILEDCETEGGREEVDY